LPFGPVDTRDLWGQPRRDDPLSRITAADTTPKIAAELQLSPELVTSLEDPALVGWEEPEPLPDALRDVMKFDIELMPESLRAMVEDIADRMQVPLDFPAITTMATLAGLTNRRAAIQPKRNDNTWIVVPNLWGGIVAEPATFKSPVIAAVTKLLAAAPLEINQARRLAGTATGNRVLVDSYCLHVRKLQELSIFRFNFRRAF